MTKTHSSLSDIEIAFMRHCVGLDTGPEPCRNHCSVEVGEKMKLAVWEGLVAKRLATLVSTSMPHHIYALTRRGRTVLEMIA